MNLLGHHFRKDLRHTRGWMLLTLLVAAGILWFPTVPLEDRVQQITWLSLLRYGGWLMLVLTVGRMVQLDAPFRDGAFLRTRPASLPTMMASKCLTALALIIPMAMLECVLLLMLDLKPGAVSLLLVFCENLLTLSAMAAVAIIIAIRKNSFGEWFSSALVWGAAIGIGMLAISWFKGYQLHGAKPDWSYSLQYLKASRTIMFQIVAFTGALVGIIAFTRSRSHKTISKTLRITAVCAIAAWLFWPINFVEAFVPVRRTAPQNEWPDQSKLAFNFVANPHQTSKEILSFSDGGWNDLTYRGVLGSYRLEGLSNGWMTAHNSYESELRLANGRVLSSHQSAWAPVQMMWILPTLGFKTSLGSPYDNPSHAYLAEFNLAKAADSMSGASLSGQLRVPIKRPVLLQKIPLKAGLSTRVADHLISIAKVENVGDGLSFKLVVQTPLYHSRGGWRSIWTDRYQYFVINAAKGEYLDYHGAGSERNPHSGHLSVRSLEFSRNLSKQYKPTQIPPDWLDGAELLIVGEEYGGSFSHSFEFSDIYLSDQR